MILPSRHHKACCSEELEPIAGESRLVLRCIKCTLQFIQAFAYCLVTGSDHGVPFKGLYNQGANLTRVLPTE